MGCEIWEPLLPYLNQVNVKKLTLQTAFASRAGKKLSKQHIDALLEDAEIPMDQKDIGIGKLVSYIYTEDQD